MPRHLPSEILGEIFSHCDQRTLGRVSRVSFGCLALSAAFLYEDIAIKSDAALACLLRIPHPSTDPDLALDKGRFDEAHPDGYQTPAILPLTRVSAYTSLCPIHSITYTGMDNTLHSFYSFAYLDRLSSFPRLALPVLVLSLPELTSGVVGIRQIVKLFDPSTFIALGPAAHFGPSQWPRLHAKDAGSPWTRLSTVILRGAILCDFEDLLVGDSPRPVREFLDLAESEQDQGEWDAAFALAFGLWQAQRVIVDGYGLGDDVPVRLTGWVESREVKEAVDVELDDPLVAALERNDISVSVPSRRVRRFLDELDDGVYKKMIWAVLGESGQDAGI